MDKELLLEINTISDFRKIDRMEPEWVYRLRKEAWEFYHKSPLPERTTNIWRYTDPEDFVISNPGDLLEWLPVLPDGSPQDIKQMKPEHSAFGYNRSDLRTFTQMTPELAKGGVVFKDLYSALRENADIAQIYFGRLIGSDFGKFESLNMALWNNGLFLYIPPGMAIEKPIYLHRHPTGQFTIPRFLAVVGENAQVTIIDDYACHCRGEGAITNSAVEIFAGDSANVRYVNLQRLADDARSYVTVRSQIGQGTSLHSIFGSIGGAMTKVNAGTILNGRGANSQMYGIVFGNEKQQFDYHTMQHHKASESFSNLEFKVILKDQARSAYTGLIRIEKDTKNCEAYQENRNLLLNRGTKAESIPELEILTDQVRCTHGATMGPIDPEMVFYLKSRGISEAEAVKAIVSGFVEPLLAHIPPDVSEILRGVVDAKLEGNAHGKRVR